MFNVLIVQNHRRDIVSTDDINISEPIFPNIEISYYDLALGVVKLRSLTTIYVYLIKLSISYYSKKFLLSKVFLTNLSISTKLSCSY
jgi:hypothetical protein